MVLQNMSVPLRHAKSSCLPCTLSITQGPDYEKLYRIVSEFLASHCITDGWRRQSLTIESTDPLRRPPQQQTRLGPRRRPSILRRSRSRSLRSRPRLLAIHHGRHGRRGCR